MGKYSIHFSEGNLYEPHQRLGRTQSTRTPFFVPMRIGCVVPFQDAVGLSRSLLSYYICIYYV